MSLNIVTYIFIKCEIYTLRFVILWHEQKFPKVKMKIKMKMKMKMKMKK